jgi:glycosyltransferase involved in cell wall biosynthesis
LKYRHGGEEATFREGWVDEVHWNSFRLGSNWPLGFLRHYRRLQSIAAEFKPDVVVGASDSFHVILAASVSKRSQIPLAVDLYDDFDAYPAARIPGIKKTFRYAVRMASGISAVSDNLAAKVKNEYRASGIVATVTNAISPDIFRPRDKTAARKRLGLPATALLTGTAGALKRQRGIPALHEAFLSLSKAIDNLFLVLAGPKERSLTPGAADKIVYLGDLPHREIGDFFASLDVGVICNRKDGFGTYCFPQKMYEMLACRLPVVAADVGAARRVLTRSERFLYDPDVPQTLSDAIRAQLYARYIPRVEIPTWTDQGILFNDLLRRAVNTPKADRSLVSSSRACEPVNGVDVRTQG